MTTPAPFLEAEDQRLKAEAVAKTSGIRSSMICPATAGKLQSSAFSPQPEVQR
jgi:hypothetical protein